jgi:fibronectin type 3 domain-containing protein
VVLLVFMIASVFAAASSVAAQDAPTVYVLADGEAVHIIMENTPPHAAAFEAYRRAPGEAAFRPLTTEAVTPVEDPHRAFDMLGEDAPWLCRRFGTADPVRLWRKVEVNRNLANTYALVSRGLRMALGRTLIDRSVQAGREYRYRVVLLDRRGREIETITRRVRVDAPEPPDAADGVHASARNGVVEITWDYRPYRGQPSDRTVGFNVYRREADGGEALINDAPVLRVEGHLSYLDREAREGAAYRYGVRAVDIIGNVSSPVYSAEVRLTDTSPPLVPMGLTAIDRDDGVLLLWDVSPDPDTSAYNVYRSDTLEGEYALMNDEPIPVEVASYLDSGMARGRPWFYAVSAVDDAGNESPRCGSETIIPTDTQPPAQVSGLAYKVHPERREVTVRWNAAPEDDLRGYMLYRRLGDGTYTRLTPKPLEPDAQPVYVDAGAPSRGLKPGGEYGYAVTATDHSGNESRRAEVTVRVPDLDPPREVFSLTARPTRSGSVELRWQPALDDDLAFHRIHRKRDDTRDEADVVAEVPAGEQSFLDERVERGVPYEYHVVEVDASGNASPPSEREVVVPVDIVAPGAPRNVQVRSHDGELILSWDAPEDADVAAYRVYRADYPGAPARFVAELNDRVYRRHGADAEGAVYTVTALDTSGNEGEGTSVAREPEQREDR